MNKQILRTLSLLCGALFLFAFPCFAAGEAESTELSLFAINIGKGDALLLRSGESVYLIDTGKKEHFDLLSAALADVDHLTGVIVTHTDKDHVGGLKSLVKSGFPVGRIYAPAFRADDGGKHPVEKAVKNTDLEITWLSAGDELPLDGGKLTVLGPLERDPEKENNNSLVLLAEGGGGSMLLTGDMEHQEEASLLTAGVIPHADVLKVGNHGEEDATSNALLSAVRPSLAVISTNSEEEPDTPDPKVLRLLASWEIPVLVTQDAPRGILVTLKDGQIGTEIR